MKENYAENIMKKPHDKGVAFMRCNSYRNKPELTINHIKTRLLSVISILGITGFQSLISSLLRKTSLLSFTGIFGKSKLLTTLGIFIKSMQLKIHYIRMFSIIIAAFIIIPVFPFRYINAAEPQINRVQKSTSDSINDIPAKNAYAYDIDCKDVRIGLEGIYKNKSSVMIYNTKIALGYSVENTYRADICLKSSCGFTVMPVDSILWESNSVYGSYNEVINRIESLKKSGIPEHKINICMNGKKVWKIVITESVRNEYSEKIYISDYKKADCSEMIMMEFGKKVIYINGNGINGYPQIAAITGQNQISAEPVALGSRNYRGRIEIGRYGKSGLTPVNIVSCEAYLKSVITGEMVSNWHIEALKAQAVCARSYLLANNSTGSDSNINKPYNLIDTDASQVYKGTGSETANGNLAVVQTEGIVMDAEGKILPAYYFSTSGGATEFSADVWGGNSTHFTGVFDEYETNPEKKPWCVKFTYDEIKNKLNSNGYTVDNIKDIYVEIYSDSERASSVKIKHAGGSLTISGDKLRSILGLASTKFKILVKDRPENEIVCIDRNGSMPVNTSELYVIDGNGNINEVKKQTTQVIAISDNNMYNYAIESPENNEIYFLGMGWGHGIGMSQSGAYGMALAGYSYNEILNYYYNGINLVRIIP